MRCMEVIMREVTVPGRVMRRIRARGGKRKSEETARQIGGRAGGRERKSRPPAAAVSFCGIYDLHLITSTITDGVFLLLLYLLLPPASFSVLLLPLLHQLFRY